MGGIKINKIGKNNNTYNDGKYQEEEFFHGLSSQEVHSNIQTQISIFFIKYILVFIGCKNVLNMQINEDKK